MPDWSRLISERMGVLALSGEVRDEVVAELATHLEELYQACRARGANESQAIEIALSMGESSSDLPILSAWAQSTPLVPDFRLINWLAMPTPIIEPISVRELEAGKPSHQVPRFHKMAAISSAKTIAKPALLPTCKINSTGSRETMPTATAPDGRYDWDLG
jgi:hypothetical protein